MGNHSHKYTLAQIKCVTCLLLRSHVWMPFKSMVVISGIAPLFLCVLFIWIYSIPIDIYLVPCCGGHENQCKWRRYELKIIGFIIFNWNAQIVVLIQKDRLDEVNMNLNAFIDAAYSECHWCHNHVWIYCQISCTNEIRRQTNNKRLLEKRVDNFNFKSKKIRKNGK